MYLKSLEITQLYSFGKKVLIDFMAGNYKTLIVGKNNDEQGMDSNGSGKSSILNVIFWVLLGETLQDESIEDIVKRGCSKGSAILTLINGTDTIVIERGRGGSKAAKFLKISINDVDQTGTTDEHTQEVLLRALNMDPNAKPKERVSDFLNTTYFSTATVNGFMSKDTKSKDRFELISRFLNLEKNDRAAKLAKEKKREVLARIDLVQENIVSIDNYIQENNSVNIAENINDTQALFDQMSVVTSNLETTLAAESARETLIAGIAQHEQGIKDTKSNTEATLQLMTGNYNEKDAFLKTLAIEKEDYYKTQTALVSRKEQADVYAIEIADLQKLVSADNEAISQLSIERGKLMHTLSWSRDQIANHLVCPSCKASVMLTNKKLEPVDKDHITAECVRIEAEINNIDAKKKVIQDKVTETATKQRDKTNLVSQYNADATAFAKIRNPAAIDLVIGTTGTEMQTLVDKSNQLVTTAKAKVAQMQEAIVTLQGKLGTNTTSTINVVLTQTEVANNKKAMEEYQQKIGALKNTLENVALQSEKLTELQESIVEDKIKADTYGFWELGFKELKIIAIEEFLPLFEDRTNHYLSLLKVNARIAFDTKREKANVSKREREEGRAFKEEFTIDVHYDDEIKPFGIHSQGERGRIALCVGFALRSLAMQQNTMSLDFLFMDEIADALDSTGLQELVKLLDVVEGQKLVISHNASFQAYFDNVITVVKTDKTSTVLQEVA